MTKNIVSLTLLLAIALGLAGCDNLNWLTALPTSAPPSSGLTLAELKYRLIDEFGGVGASQGIHYCDPDSFPVARVGAEQTQAVKLFPTISADKELFTAILNHLKLTGRTAFTDAQKLLIYQEYKKLNALTLELTSEGYTFNFAYKDASGAFQVKGIISPQGIVTIRKKDAAGAMAFECPICLVGDT